LFERLSLAGSESPAPITMLSMKTNMEPE
jgi:hypothetical protein